MIRRKICRRCKTGRKTLDIDASYPICPHITSYNKGRCKKYEKDESLSLVARLRGKLRG